MFANSVAETKVFRGLSKVFARSKFLAAGRLTLHIPLLLLHSNDITTRESYYINVLQLFTCLKAAKQTVFEYLILNYCLNASLKGSILSKFTLFPSTPLLLYSIDPFVILRFRYTVQLLTEIPF